MSTTAVQNEPAGPEQLGDGPPLPLTAGGSWAPVLALGALAAFLVVVCFLPLGSAIKIGADEDFEYAKTTCCLQGYSLYTEIWNDQPPLITFLLAGILKHVSMSVLGPRLFTVFFALILLASVFLVARRVSGLLAATWATAALITSPGFLELSCSCMQEVPALGSATASLCVLLLGRRGKWRVTEVIGGAVFGFALQMKLIELVYVPLAGLILWLRNREGGAPLRAAFVSFVLFGTGAVASFLALNEPAGGPLLLQFQQSWSAHFAAPKSLETGSPAEHVFDWTVLLKNWDTTVPALVGVALLVRSARREPMTLLPLAWLGLTFAVFPLHKPWWAYYYVHNTVPLCWAAGVGVAGLWKWATLPRSGPELETRSGAAPTAALVAQICPDVSGYRRIAFCRAVDHPEAPERRINARGRARQASLTKSAASRLPTCDTADYQSALPWRRAAIPAVCVLAAALWMGGRLYVEAAEIRRLPRLHSCLVLKEIERFKPFTKFLFTDEPIYSFHAQIPMPPHLAVISLKRIWSGDLNSERLVAELEDTKPGLILVRNGTEELPYQDLLDRDYRLVYQDDRNRLYAHRSISRKAKY